MKTKLLIFFVVINTLLQQELIAQDYHPLIRSNTYWDVMKANSLEPCLFYSGGRYFFEGDTILDDLHYSIVRAFPILSFGTGGFCPPYAVDGSISVITHFMREDTIAKKVFIYDEWSGDVLLYDFSLDVNDTLISPIMPPLLVDSIGYINLLNGEQRKIFHFYHIAHEYYIESIGGSSGLFNVLPKPIDMYDAPGCVLENDVWLFNFGLDWGEECYLYVGVNEHRKTNRAIIYPNPVKRGGYITLKAKDVIHMLTITDIHGSRVEEIDVRTSNPFNEYISISYLKSGVYFIELQTINNKIYYEKLFILD